MRLCYNRVEQNRKEMRAIRLSEERCALAREIVRRQAVRPVLAERGVGEDEFLSWLEDERFAAYLYRMAERDAASKAPEVWQRLCSEATDGNLRAIKLYFDICGRERAPTEEPEEDTFSIETVRRELFGDE